MAHFFPVDLASLGKITAFQDLPDEVLQWLQQNGELRQYADGEITVEEGEPADTLWGVVRGAIHSRQRGPNPGLSLLLEAGGVAGILPYSRMQVIPAQGIAVGDTLVYMLHRRYFTILEQVSPELVQRLVTVMNDRVREEARSMERDDKLRALGKLAAGLSHEINNPAASIGRAAAALTTALDARPALLHTLLTAGLPAPAVASLLALAARPLAAAAPLTPLQATDREDELADWLVTQGCAECYALAPDLLDAGLTLEVLAPTAALLPPGSRPAALTWLGGHLTTRRLAQDVGEASHRISTLVKDVKTYSHMDRAPDRELLSVTTGLDSTANMLSFALRQKNVRIHHDYAPNLPAILGRVSSLNQVWTNLLDNALYALPDQGGELTIRVRQAGYFLLVDIEDNGAGISPDVLTHLFEPFFTTKPPGEGTGQGLNIARRIAQEHGGRIEATSEPGRTVFSTWLPLPQQSAN